MEACAGQVSVQECTERASGRPYEHSSDDFGRVMVLAQDVAEAAAVAEAHGAQAGRRERLLVVLDNEGWVVLDPSAAVQRADEVVDLLAGAPPCRRPEAQLLVEAADLLHDGAAQEDRERDRTVPEVDAGEPRGLALPRRRGEAVRSRGTPGEPIERRIAGEFPADPLEQVVRIGAVVVGKGDDVRRQLREGGVARS